MLAGTILALGTVSAQLRGMPNRLDHDMMLADINLEEIRERHHMRIFRGVRDYEEHARVQA